MSDADFERRFLERFRQLESRRPVKAYPTAPKSAQGGEDEVAVYPKANGTGFAVKFKGKWREVGFAEGGGDPYGRGGMGTIIYADKGPGWNEIERLDALIQAIVDRINAYFGDKYRIIPTAIAFLSIEAGTDHDDAEIITLTAENWSDYSCYLHVTVVDDAGDANAFEISYDQITWSQAISGTDIELVPMSHAGGGSEVVYVRPNLPLTLGDTHTCNLQCDFMVGATAVHTINVPAQVVMGLAANFTILPYKNLHMANCVIGATEDGYVNVPKDKYFEMKNTGGSAASGQMTVLDGYFRANFNHDTGPWISLWKYDEGTHSASDLNVDTSGSVTLTPSIVDGRTVINWTIGSGGAYVRFYPRALPVHEGLADGMMVQDNILEIKPGWASPYDDYRVIVDAEFADASIFIDEQSGYHFGAVQSGQTKTHRINFFNQSTRLDCRVFVEFDSGAPQYFDYDAIPPTGWLAANPPADPGDYFKDLDPGEGWYLDVEFAPTESFSYHEELINFVARFPSGGTETTYPYTVSGTGVAEGAVLFFEGTYEHDPAGDAHDLVKIDFGYINALESVNQIIYNYGTESGDIYMYCTKVTGLTPVKYLIQDADGGNSSANVNDGGAYWDIDTAIPAGGRMIIKWTATFNSLPPGATSASPSFWITSAKIDMLALASVDVFKKTADAYIIWEYDDPVDSWIEIDALDMQIVRIATNYTDTEVRADLRLHNIGGESTGDVSLVLQGDAAFTVSAPALAPTFALAADAVTNPATQPITITLTAPNSIPEGESEQYHEGTISVSSMPTGALNLTGRSGRYYVLSGLDPDNPAIQLGQVARGSSSAFPLTITNVSDVTVVIRVHLYGTGLAGVDNPALSITDPAGNVIVPAASPGFDAAGGFNTLNAGVTGTWVVALSPDFDDPERALDDWADSGVDTVVLRVGANIDAEGEESGSVIAVKGMVASDKFWCRPVIARHVEPPHYAEGSGVQLADFENTSQEYHSFTPAFADDYIGGRLVDNTAMTLSPGGRYPAFYRQIPPYSAIQYIRGSAPDTEVGPEKVVSYPVLMTSGVDQEYTLRGNSGTLNMTVARHWLYNFYTARATSTFGHSPHYHDFGYVQAYNFLDAWRHRILVGIANLSESPNATFTIRVLSHWGCSLGDYLPIWFKNVVQTNDYAPTLGWATKSGTENNVSPWNVDATNFYTITALPYREIAYLWLIPNISTGTYANCTEAGKVWHIELGIRSSAGGVTNYWNPKLTIKASPAPGAPSTTITAPRAEDVWSAGDDRQVVWESDHFIHQVKLKLHQVDPPSGTVMDIVTTTINSGDYYWENLDKDALHAYGSKFRIKLYDLANTYRGQSEEFIIEA